MNLLLCRGRLAVLAALSSEMQNLFGESVWSGNVPVAAQIVVDTHEVGDEDSKSSDNLHVSQSVDTTSGSWQSGYLPSEPHIEIAPLHPMLDSSIDGLQPGRVYDVKNGRAVDLLDGTAHPIIAAGSANLQPGEVFGVYHIIAAGSGNIIAAGSAN